MIEENEYAPTEPARKKFKPKRGLGSAITRKRRLQAEQLQEQIDARKQRERDAALRELQRLKDRDKSRQNSTNDRWANAILRSVINNQTALLRVWGFKQGVQCSVSPHASHVDAWTDFKRINVTWPQEAIPNRLDRAAVLDTIAQMKGVMQHEMGHVRFTTSYKTVIDNVTQHPKHPQGLVFKCWNLLEDQRMESLVVEAVPRIRNYFGTMVANVVLDGGNLPMEQTWLMLAGRAYMPKAVLRKSYELFDQFCFDQGIQGGAMTWYNLVSDYKAATTHQGIYDAVVAAYEFIQLVRATMPDAVDNMDPMQRAENEADPQQTGRPQGNILDMFDEKPKQPGKGKEKGEGSGDGEGEGGESDLPPGTAEDYDDRDSGPGGQGGKDDAKDAKDGDGKGEGEGGKKKENKTSSPNQSNHGDGSETKSDEGDLSDMLSEAVQQMTESMRNDSDVKDMARGANQGADAEGLPEYPNQPDQMSDELIQRAHYTAVGIEKALTSFVTDSAPIWHSRREHGIIDALAYRTKNVGDRDFRRQLDDKGNIGLDVHLSMLCDVSGSMGSAYGSRTTPIVALSEALYASAIACRNLGIGGTYTLWSSDNQNYRVWGDGQVSPTLWPSMGGTDPTKALDDLDSHNPEGAEKHLVVIFTDGAWANNFPSLTRWGAENRTFILVRYGNYEGAMQKDMGADRHIQITDVAQLPEELTKALIEVLADGGGW